MMVTTGGRAFASGSASASLRRVSKFPPLAGEVRLLLVRLPAKLLRHARGGGVIDLLVDGGHHAELHQLLDDLDASRLQLLR
jgi:hypothetical protein